MRLKGKKSSGPDCATSAVVADHRVAGARPRSRWGHCYRQVLSSAQLCRLSIPSETHAAHLSSTSRATSKQSSLVVVLGSGEVESFVLAQTHHLICLTNDRQAKAVAHRLSLSYLDLEEILRAFKTKTILVTEELSALMNHIERADRTRIKAKEDILNNWN
jgi:hypothetical protein